MGSRNKTITNYMHYKLKNNSSSSSSWEIPIRKSYFFAIIVNYLCLRNCLSDSHNDADCDGRRKRFRVPFVPRTFHIRDLKSKLKKNWNVKKQYFKFWNEMQCFLSSHTEFVWIYEHFKIKALSALRYGGVKWKVKK